MGRQSKAILKPIVETQNLGWASDEQQAAFEFGPAPLCLSGGYGSSKTWVACMKFLWLGSIFPGSRWMILRRRWNELKETTLKTFFKLCPIQAYQPYGRWSVNEKSLILNNGTEYLWFYADDPEAATIIQGVEINGFFMDQAEEIQEEVFEKLLARVSRWDQGKVTPEALALAGGRENWEWVNEMTGELEIPPYVMIACNPDNELHWIYRRFHPESEEHYESPGIDPVTGDPIPSYHDQGYRMMTMTSDSNKFLSKAALGQLKNKDESFQRRYRRGEWGIPEGQIHKVPKESLIEGTPENLEKFAKIKQRCTLHRSMDHGESAPTCCAWWAADSEGNLYIHREYYRGDALVSQHREAITRLSEGEEYDFSLADPSIFDPSMQKGGEKWSIAQEYADRVDLPAETAIFWEAAINDELSTRNRINEFLLVDPAHKNPFTGELGAPRLYFILKSPENPNGVNEILKQTRAQRRERVGMHLGRPIFSDDRDKKMVDHAYDPVRYFIASRPSKGVREKTKVPRRSFEGIRREIKKNKRKGIEAAIRKQAHQDALVRRFARA